MRYFLLVTVLLSFLTSGLGQYHNDKVLLRDVNSLLFKDGYMTHSRRVAPIPQLRCIGDCQFKPTEIGCQNVGLDDSGNIKWRCETNHNKNYQVGNFKVSCEGYHHSTDPYVLKGSCGLSYEMKPKPGAYYNSRRNHHSSSYNGKPNYVRYQRHIRTISNESFTDFVIGCLYLFLILYIIYFMFGIFDSMWTTTTVYRQNTPPGYYDRWYYPSWGNSYYHNTHTYTHTHTRDTDQSDGGMDNGSETSVNYADTENR